ERPKTFSTNNRGQSATRWRMWFCRRSASYHARSSKTIRRGRRICHALINLPTPWADQLDQILIRVAKVKTVPSARPFHAALDFDTCGVQPLGPRVFIG